MLLRHILVCLVRLVYGLNVTSNRRIVWLSRDTLKLAIVVEQERKFVKFRPRVVLLGLFNRLVGDLED